MSEPLLRIELEDESSYPKVFYKGEQLRFVLEANFEYKVGELSELSFMIKNHRKHFVNDVVGMTKTYTHLDRRDK